MAKEIKSTPAAALSPETHTDPVGGKQEDEKINIQLLISGGVHSERFNFDFALNEKGQLSCGIDCMLSNRKAHLKNRAIKINEVEGLVRTIKATDLLSQNAYLGQFVPCTLVGILKLRIGDRYYETRFAADPEQAKTQKIEAPKGLDKSLESIYSLAAKNLKVKSVRPGYKQRK